jgi:UDP-N-acetylglucosamine 2-epimerase (non-hydrolysing)
MSRIDIILGTRPEIIKLAPLIRRCVSSNVPMRIVHTGQHYDPLLDTIFFQELALPEPHVNLQAAAASQGQFFGNLFPALETLWSADRPSGVVVQGDTNSAFAGALVAQRLGIRVAHVEAGLRSDDRTMPEEINRILIDRVAERLYAPTRTHAQRLEREGVDPSFIVVTGNTVADAVAEHLEAAKDAPLPSDLPARYAVVTLHRPALVDDAERLRLILDQLAHTCEAQGITALFPVHPRTRKHLTDWSHPHIRLQEPVGYLSMLRLLSGAAIVVTDSGGLQEEAAILHVPCVTVRENTERPETVEAGGNIVAGLAPAGVARAIEDMLRKKIDWKPLYEQTHPSDVMLEDLRTHCL